MFSNAYTDVPDTRQPCLRNCSPQTGIPSQSSTLKIACWSAAPEELIPGTQADFPGISRSTNDNSSNAQVQSYDSADQSEDEKVSDGYSPETSDAEAECSEDRSKNADAGGRVCSFNRSRYRGVSYDKKKRKWRVQIKVATLGKSGVSVGYFDTEESAAKAYDKAAIGLLGLQPAMAVLNFPADNYNWAELPVLQGKSRDEVKAALKTERAKQQAPRRRYTSKTRTSRFIGVGSTNRKHQWQARILVEGKVTHLGYYRTEEEAARVYDRVSIVLHGFDGAQTNFPKSNYEKEDFSEYRGLTREELQRSLGVRPMDKSSKYRGVSRKKNKWEAKVMVNRKWAYRELFDSEEEAARAYDKAVWKLKPMEALSYVNFMDTLPDHVLENQNKQPKGSRAAGSKKRQQAHPDCNLDDQELTDKKSDYSIKVESLNRGLYRGMVQQRNKGSAKLSPGLQLPEEHWDLMGGAHMSPSKASHDSSAECFVDFAAAGSRSSTCTRGLFNAHSSTRQSISPSTLLGLDQHDFPLGDIPKIATMSSRFGAEIFGKSAPLDTLCPDGWNLWDGMPTNHPQSVLQRLLTHQTQRSQATSSAATTPSMQGGMRSLNASLSGSIISDFDYFNYDPQEVPLNLANGRNLMRSGSSVNQQEWKDVDDVSYLFPRDFTDSYVYQQMQSNIGLASARQVIQPGSQRSRSLMPHYWLNMGNAAGVMAGDAIVMGVDTVENATGHQLHGLKRSRNMEQNGNDPLWRMPQLP